MTTFALVLAGLLVSHLVGELVLMFAGDFLGGRK